MLDCFSEVLVGFDARIVWSEQAAPQPDAGPGGDIRNRMMVAEPYSTDALTWPSVFDKGIGIGMDVEWRRHLRQTGVKMPAWTGPVGRTWESLVVMQQYLHEKASEIQQPYWTIAICAYCEEDYLNDWYFAHDAFRMESAYRDICWPLLGYDVADYSLNSTLSTYWSRKLDDLRKWIPRLNEHHLFSVIEDAREYRDHVDETFGLRDGQEIYGIYHVQDHPAEDRATVRGTSDAA